MPFVTPKFEAIEYDGTNGQHIANEWLSNATLVSDDGETLTIEVPGWPSNEQRSIAKGFYVMAYGGRVYYQAIEAATYLQDWTEIPQSPTP